MGLRLGAVPPHRVAAAAAGDGDADCRARGSGDASGPPPGWLSLRGRIDDVVGRHGRARPGRALSGPYHVRGLRIVPGDASSPAAFKARYRNKALSVAVGPEPERHFDVEIPQDPASAGPAKAGAPYWVALPAPVDTACVTVVLRDVYRGSEPGPRAGGTTAISDLAVFTDLDGAAGVDRLIADTASGSDCASRVPMLASLGEGAVAPLSKALGEARGEGRGCLVQALAGIAAATRNEAALTALVGALPNAGPSAERSITEVLARAEHPLVV